MKRIVAAWVASTCLLSGCVTTSNLDRQAAVTVAPQETVFVFGVQPRYRVALAKGSTDGQKWNRDHNAVATTNTFPDDGYIVVKVPSLPAPQTYAIAQILPEGIGGFVPNYQPCTGNDLVVFPAPAGKVVYVGDVDYRLVDNKLALAYSWQPEKAREHLATAYPALLPRLEASQGAVLTMNNTRCGPASLHVHVYLPGR